MSVDTELNVEAPFAATIREDLVQTAVKFLQNSNVINTPLAQKQKFLQRKGLTDAEIQEACERSGAYDVHEQHLQAPRRQLQPQMQLQQVSWLERVKQIVHSAALLSAVIYGIYIFYQKVIRRFFFGDKKKNVEDAIKDLEKSLNESVNEVRISISCVKDEVDKISQSSGTQRQLQELKGEISCVKGLLLNRLVK